MRIRRIAISAAFATGLAALPLSTAKAQYYPPFYYSGYYGQPYFPPPLYYGPGYYAPPNYYGPH